MGGVVSILAKFSNFQQLFLFKLGSAKGQDENCVDNQNSQILRLFAPKIAKTENHQV